MKRFFRKYYDFIMFLVYLVVAYFVFDYVSFEPGVWNFIIVVIFIYTLRTSVHHLGNIAFPWLDKKNLERKNRREKK